MSDEARESIVGLLCPAEYFYWQKHRLIFRKISQLQMEHAVVNEATLVEALRETSELEKVGGAAYIAGLTVGVPVPTTRTMLEYLKILRELHNRRELVNASADRREGTGERGG